MSGDGTLERLLESLEILQRAEDALRACRSPEVLRSRARDFLSAVLRTTEIRELAVAGADAESDWARQNHRALVVPLPEARFRVILPLSAGPGEPCLEGTTDLPAAQLASLQHVLDRFVAAAETAFRNVRETERHSRARLLLDSILDSIPLAILAVDASGRVLAANANTEVLFGVRRIDLLQDPVGEVIPGAAGKELAALFDQVVRDGRVHEVEIDHSTGRGKVSLGIAASPLGGPGSGAAGVVYVCRDLRYTRELQKLRELNSLKSEFAHTVSHELKTPLTAITGSVDLLKLDEDKLDPRQREMVDLIGQGAKRLQEMITDILALSRMERGAVGLELQAVSVMEALEVVKGRLPAEARRRVRLRARRALVAAADPLKLTEILENLVSNALKYSPAPRPVEVTAGRTGGMIRLSVRDRGIGIRASDRRHLFEKFFRGENARKLGVQGTGLGLAITRELVRLHGGRMTCRSRRGQGTTFVVELPEWVKEKGDEA